MSEVRKLELKHLAPYRPYGLKFVMTSDYLDEFGHYDDWSGKEEDYKKGAVWTYAGEIDEDLMIPLGDGDISRVFKKDNTYISIKCNGIKPILRPLSDLTKEIFDLSFSWKTNPNIYSIATIKNRLITNNLTYYDQLFLIELHFDVFGLIDQGLAIDINTLNK